MRSEARNAWFELILSGEVRRVRHGISFDQKTLTIAIEIQRKGKSFVDHGKDNNKISTKL